MPAPHLADVAPTTSRRGSFWIPGERVRTPGGTVPRGPMYVAWEAPADTAHPLPLVLVHGGGGQGLDYLAIPDGRPGWASLMVDAGYAVYVVDRPSHGRSAHHPDVLGPMGPPFAEMPGMGPLRWGLSAAPLRFDPPAGDPAALDDGTPRRLVGLADIPTTVVTGEASPFTAFDREVVAFLRRFGCDAERLHLADHAVHGNGHAMMLERNHADALAPILAWIDAHAGVAAC